MWIKKFKKKKLQFTVLGIILAFATMILSTCLSFSKEVSRYTDSQYDDPNNADILLYAMPGTSQMIKSKLNERPDIKQLETYNYFDITTFDIYHNDSLLQEYITPLQVLIIENYKDMPFKLTPVDGDQSSVAPAPGEVWVQNIVADSHGIYVDDSFDIKDKVNSSLRVTSLVNDSRKPISMTIGGFVFINEQDANLFKSAQPRELIGITTDSDTNEILAWLEDMYTNELYVFRYETVTSLRTAATLMTTMVSSLGTLSSIFMLIITLIITKFFIKNTIINEYSAIGTYKSVGFSTSEIIGFYLKCYSLVGIISIIIGALLGLPMSIFIGQIVMEYIGEYSLSTTSIYLALSVTLTTSFILLLSIWIALIRIRKITPVDAFRVGATSSKSTLKKSFIKHAHSAWSMSINDIFKYKSRSILIVLIVSISFYIGIFLLNMC